MLPHMIKDDGMIEEQYGMVSVFQCIYTTTQVDMGLFYIMNNSTALMNNSIHKGGGVEPPSLIEKCTTQHTGAVYLYPHSILTNIFVWMCQSEAFLNLYLLCSQGSQGYKPFAASLISNGLNKRQHS